METLEQVLDRAVEENQWDEDPDEVIADVRAKCEGIAMGDPRIWEVLIPEAEPADQLLFQKVEMGESEEKIARKRLEVVQKMSGALLSKENKRGWKSIDGLKWCNRVSYCVDPIQHRCAFRTFGILEADWGVRKRMSEALEGKGQYLAAAIEHKRNMDGTVREWQEFYSWLMEGQDSGSRIRSARTADDFLTLTEELVPEQYETVATLVAEPEVRAELQQRLDALEHPEELQWPWEALAKAWGVKEEDEPEVAEKRREVAGVVIGMVEEGDGASSRIKWNERLQWCEAPGDFRCLLVALGVPEQDWRVRDRMCKSLVGNRGASLTKAIERKRNMNGTIQGWKQFHTWLMEGQDPGSRIRAARSADDFLSLTEEFAGEQYQQISGLVAEPEVRAELQQRLDALEHPEELQWPWEALAKAWGVKEDDEPEVAENRRAVAEVVVGMARKWETDNKKQWDKRVAWCEEREDYCCLLRVFGIPESAWGMRSGVFLFDSKHRKKTQGLVQAIERKRNMDGTKRDWQVFYTWLMEEQDPNSRIRAARSTDDFLTLTEEFAWGQYQQVAALVAEPDVRTELQQRLDALEQPEELQWPWEALAKAWGVNEEDEPEVAGKRRAVATVVVGMVTEKEKYNRLRWNARIAWCKEASEYRSILQLLGIPESFWGVKGRLIEALEEQGKGLILAIERKRNMDGSAGDWRKFHAWLMDRLPEQGFQSVPEVREYAGKEVARVLETGEMQEQLERRREQGEPDLNVERLLAQLQEDPLCVFDHEYMVQGNGGDELTFGNPVFDEAMAYLAKK